MAKVFRLKKNHKYTVNNGQIDLKTNAKSI